MNNFVQCKIKSGIGNKAKPYDVIIRYIPIMSSKAYFYGNNVMSVKICVNWKIITVF